MSGGPSKWSRCDRAGICWKVRLPTMSAGRFHQAQSSSARSAVRQVESGSSLPVALRHRARLIVKGRQGIDVSAFEAIRHGGLPFVVYRARIGTQDA